MGKNDQFLGKYSTFHFINRMVFLFIIYSFLGWVIETSFILFMQHHFSIRGLLGYGLPLAPQYGLFGIIIVKLLSPLKKKPLLLLIEAFCITSILEYLFGVVERNIFHMKTWDYSNIPFSYDGIISLPISICWSLLSLLAIYFIDSKLNKLFDCISPRFLAMGTWIVMLYMVICFGIIFRPYF